MFSASWFENLDAQLRKMGLDSDDKSFDEIKENLSHPKKLSPIEFANTVSYVILAGGFSQKTAKKIHAKIMAHIRANGADFDELMKLFANKNKMERKEKLM